MEIKKEMEREKISNKEYSSDLNTIAKILTNGVIRLHTKEQREARTQETKELINSYSAHPKLIGSTGLPPQDEQKYSTQES